MSAKISSGSYNKLPEDGNIDFKEVFNKYLYHWPLFVAGIVFFLAITFIYLRYAKPVYQITTTILIKDSKGGNSSTDLLKEIDLFDGGSKVVDNEIEILKSKALMRRVVDRLHLDIYYEVKTRFTKRDLYSENVVNFVPIALNEKYYNHSFKITFPDTKSYVMEQEDGALIVKGPLNAVHRTKLGSYKIERIRTHREDSEYFISFPDPAGVADKMLSNLSIAVSSKLSTVLMLSYESSVPERGKEVLNTLINVYNESSLYDKNRTTTNTLKFIDERLGLITGELNEVEKEVEGFKSGQGLTNISSEAELYLSNVQNNDAKLNEVSIKLGVVSDIKRYLNSNSSQEKLPSTLGIDDPVLLNQISKLSDLQLQRDQLLATTQADNPLLDPITSQIETTRESIRTNVENVESILASTKRGLEGNNAAFESSIRKIPGQERAFISIKRQQTIKESLYLYLLQKKEEMALSFASSIADTRVVDPAYSSKNPIKPQKQIFYLGAFLLGLIVPAGILYLRNQLNDKIEEQGDLSKLTSVPVVGSIAQEEGSAAIVVDVTSRRAIAEQFRALRTNMQYIHGKILDKGRVTLLTSSMSGEGKSFIASNLATALALSGRKVVLLELDLRKPKISKYLNLGNKIGMSNYLVGNAKMEAIIQPSGVHENLHVIGSGSIPPNPSELLVNKEIEILIEYLRGNYDDVLIDTPPIGLVTDAQILSRLSDVTLYVVRKGITFKKQITELEQIKLKGVLPRINIILNGIQLGGGYGYGYGYYSDTEGENIYNVKKLRKELFKRF